MAQITERMVARGSENALYGFEGAAMYFQKGKWTKAGHRGGVAQLVEHLLCKQGVIGSNPFTSTIQTNGVRECDGLCEDEGS